MESLNPKVTFEQILKSPPVYMLMVAVAMLSFFVYKYALSTEQVNANCEAEKTELRKELKQVRADNAAFVTAIMVKNGIILQQAQDKKELDSAIENKLRPKAREILKEQ
jgi:hypothetical protein